MSQIDLKSQIKIIGSPGLKSQFELVLNKMLNTTDFDNLLKKAITRHKGITYHLVTSNGTASQALNENITIDMNFFKIEYKVKLPDGYEEQFSHIENYDQWEATVKSYEKNNQWKPFSLERHIFHETYHSAVQDSSGIRYTLNKDAYENPAIRAANAYVLKHYDQAPRVEDHNAWRISK